MNDNPDEFKKRVVRNIISQLNGGIPTPQPTTRRVVWVTLSYRDEGRPPTLTLMPEFDANLLQLALASPTRREGDDLDTISFARFSPAFEVAQVATTKATPPNNSWLGAFLT